MESSALTVLLVLMGTAFSLPSKLVCQSPCSPSSEHDMHHYHHVHHMSELQHSSVAPWKISVDQAEDREPSCIEHAECKNCTVKDMVAKPIFVQIKVLKRLGHSDSWCRCPYELAVGCTCVREQKQ